MRILDDLLLHGSLIMLVLTWHLCMPQLGSQSKLRRYFAMINDRRANKTRSPAHPHTPKCFDTIDVLILFSRKSSRSAGARPLNAPQNGRPDKTPNVAQAICERRAGVFMQACWRRSTVHGSPRGQAVTQRDHRSRSLVFSTSASATPPPSSSCKRLHSHQTASSV